jgi:3-oxoacyl-[acyl-carrier protein] reductase
MGDDDWDAVMNVNLKGVFYCTRAVARVMMKQRWGKIVNIASVVGVTGNPGQANYAASKAGILGFTRSIARELAGRSITVNAVAPGFIETDMTKSLSDKARESFLQGIPLGRPGTPGDVANLVSFLVSEDAAYITGQVVHVDGGLVMS